MTQSRIWPVLLWSALWLILVGVALATRPLLPMDETRYLSVAWEMHLRGDYLVPHLNGATYSHKPPLLFWLLNLGWAVFGVNEWWPRLVAPLFGLATLFATGALARRLWPDLDGDHQYAAPLILLGAFLATIYTTITMFDMMLAFMTVIAILGIVMAWQAGRPLGIILFALGTGFGVLVKGPAILLHVLPVALSAPWWGPVLQGSVPGERSLVQWYIAVVVGVIGAVVIALAWALPAGIAGGEAYRDAIFWGQSAGRMVDSFAHREPWWFYLAIIGPLAMPWCVWPPVWRAIGAVDEGNTGIRAATLADGGARLCLVWFATAFLAFSAISGKQPHYLLPEFPALALILAMLLARRATKDQAKGTDQVIPGLVLVIIGLTAISVEQSSPEPIPGADTLQLWWLVSVIVVAIAVAAIPAPSNLFRIAGLTILSVTLFVSIHLAARPLLLQAFDLKPLAETVRAWQSEGRGVAHFGTYHGQFQFLGRLSEPVAAIGLRDDDVETWLAANPTGRIVSYRRCAPTDGKPIYTQPFRGRIIVVWDAASIAANPALAERGSKADCAKKP
jgi:4-amino-4-deoxy-L-arabinose transferase-like glycosyltransferase